MANVRLTWGLPTLRESKLPIDPATIAGVELAVSADSGANFVVTDPLVEPNVLETIFSDLSPGTWQFRGVVIDTSARRGKPKFATILVPDDSAPGELLTLEATLA